MMALSLDDRSPKQWPPLRTVNGMHCDVRKSSYARTSSSPSQRSSARGKGSGFPAEKFLPASTMRSSPACTTVPRSRCASFDQSILSSLSVSAVTVTRCSEVGSGAGTSRRSARSFAAIRYGRLALPAPLAQERKCDPRYECWTNDG